MASSWNKNEQPYNLWRNVYFWLIRFIDRAIGTQVSEQNDPYFADHISIAFSWMKSFVFWPHALKWGWLLIHAVRSRCCCKPLGDSGVGVTKPISSVTLFSDFFQNYQNTHYLLKITFIFDRCRRSSAAVAPVKYKCDSNNLRITFARSKILLTEKLTNGPLVPPQIGAFSIPATVKVWRGGH